MNKKTLKTVKLIASFILGFLLIFSSLFTYREHFAETYELTFLSSFISGLFFIISCIFILLNKKIPQIFYLCATILLLIVFFVCIAFINRFNFGGGFAFLHIINPVVVLIYYIFLCDMRGTKAKFVPFVAAAPLTYLIFVLIFGSVTGNFIYFFLNYEKYGIWYSVAFVSAILAGIFIFGFALYFLNISIQKKLKINEK